MKYLLWLVLFALVPMSMIVSRVGAQDITEPPPIIEELPIIGTALEEKMEELFLVIPYALQEELTARRWVAWRMMSLKLEKTDEIVAYVVQYLSQVDNDRYFAGEEYRGKMLRAEAVFCHKHKRLSHFRWNSCGVWKVEMFHDRNGVM